MGAAKVPKSPVWFQRSGLPVWSFRSGFLQHSRDVGDCECVRLLACVCVCVSW